MRKTKEQNSKHKIPKTNNGITLIALIITIIVMIILVAVTVTMAVNGGLFSKAQTAGTQTNEAVKKEQELGNGRIKIGGTWYDSPQDYVNNKPSADQGDTATGAKDETTGDNDETTDNTDEELTLTISGENEVDVRNSITLTLKDNDGNVISENVTWSSSNETVATVENGIVTGKNAYINDGNVTIKVAYNNTELEKEIVVEPIVCTTCNGDYKGDWVCSDCLEIVTEEDALSKGEPWWYVCCGCGSFWSYHSIDGQLCQNCDTWDYAMEYGESGGWDSDCCGALAMMVYCTDCIRGGIYWSEKN